MGYKEAMEAAGANILTFECFGDYQGTWWALVEYNGQKGWVQGSFGSCSYCDAFESEFDYASHEHSFSYYNPIYSGFMDNCERCQEVKQKFIEFGESYLDNIISQDEAVRIASKNLDWDHDAMAVLNYLNMHNF